MKVKFVPQDIEYEILPDESVLQMAQRNGVKIHSLCNGLPSCAECRVRLIEGEYNVIPPSQKELSLIGTGYYIDGRRLSCQLRCFGDITVDLVEQIGKEKSNEIRRPQGSLKKDDSEVSHAVLGNLIDQDKDILSEVSSDVEDFQSPESEQSNNGSAEGAQSRSSQRRRRHRGRRNKQNKQG